MGRMYTFSKGRQAGKREGLFLIYLSRIPDVTAFWPKAKLTADGQSRRATGFAHAQPHSSPLD